MENVARDLTVLLVIAVFLALIVGIAYTGNSTAFWYGQIVLQLIMGVIGLWIAFGRGD